MTPDEVAKLRELINAPARPHGMVAGFGLVIVVIVILGAVAFGVSAFALEKDPGMGVERYLAVVAAGGAIGLSIGLFSDLMKSIGGDGKLWGIVAATGKVSASFWAAAVSLVAALG